MRIPSLFSTIQSHSNRYFVRHACERLSTTRDVRLLVSGLNRCVGYRLRMLRTSSYAYTKCSAKISGVNVADCQSFIVWSIYTMSIVCIASVSYLIEIWPVNSICGSTRLPFRLIKGSVFIQSIIQVVILSEFWKQCNQLAFGSSHAHPAWHSQQNANNDKRKALRRNI